MMLNGLQLFQEMKSWAKSTQVIFETVGFNIVWLKQCVENVNFVLSVFKQRLYLEDINALD